MRLIGMSMLCRVQHKEHERLSQIDNVRGVVLSLESASQNR